MKEPYIASNGACEGIVDELYVIPGPMLSTPLAPLLPPYVMQSIFIFQK